MNKKILLTGATGFVGHHVLKNLISRNLRISIIIRDDNILLSEEIDKIESIYFTKNLFKESHDNLCRITEGVDTIIHCAWYTKPSNYLVATENLECLEGTVKLGLIAKKNRVRRFIGIGTCLEYDYSHRLPLEISSPIRPISQYAKSKNSVFEQLSSEFEDSSIQFSWCRLFYLYGEGENNNRLVPYIHNQLRNSKEVYISNGDYVRDYMKITDAAELIVNVALSEHIGPVNICSGKAVTVKELAEKISDEYGMRELLQFRSTQNSISEPQFIVGVPNWKV